MSSTIYADVLLICNYFEVPNAASIAAYWKIAQEVMDNFSNPNDEIEKYIRSWLLYQREGYK